MSAAVERRVAQNHYYEGMHVLLSPEVTPVEEVQVLTVPKVYSYPDIMAYARTGELPQRAPVVYDRRLIGAPTRYRMLELFEEEAYAVIDGFCIVHPTGPHGESSIMLVEEKPTDLDHAFQFVHQVPVDKLEDIFSRVANRFRRASLGGHEQPINLPEEISIGTTYGSWCSFDGLHFQISERSKEELASMDVKNVNGIHPNITHLLTENIYGQESMFGVWQRLSSIADKIGIVDHEVLSSGVLKLTLDDRISLDVFLAKYAAQVWGFIEQSMELEWQKTLESHNQPYDPSRMCASIVMRQVRNNPAEIRIGVAMQMDPGVKPVGGGIFAICDRVKEPSNENASLQNAAASHARGLGLAIDLVNDPTEQLKLMNAQAIMIGIAQSTSSNVTLSPAL